jgi:2-hydroxycyclohexanecarboxyl-CoA dehydrogenase
MSFSKIGRGCQEHLSSRGTLSPLVIDLTGQTAVITGAGGGIGAAIAHALASAGASVACADIDDRAAESTAAAITQAGGSAAAFSIDVTSVDGVRALRRSVEDTIGTASVLVNNAGWGRPEPFLENTESLWEQVISVNLMGVMRVSQAFLDPMVEQGSGKIVNIASDAGRVGSSGETAYAGTKGGVIAFTKSLARELARHGINVNCVCPGPTDTALFHKHSERMQEALTRAIPFRRLARPDEIAGAVAFFASDQAGFITGQVLSVSGGLTMAG